jgi:hypothetical protein
MKIIRKVIFGERAVGEPLPPPSLKVPILRIDLQWNNGLMK